MPSRTPAHASSLSFVLSQLGAKAAVDFARALGPAGLTPRGYAVVAELRTRAAPTQQELADTLGIHRNSMVGLLDDLEAAGLVRRERDERDRRAFRIHLTHDGQAAATRGAQIATELDADLAGHLDDVIRQQLIAQLLDLADRQGLQRGRHTSVPDQQGTGRAE